MQDRLPARCLETGGIITPTGRDYRSPYREGLPSPRQTTRELKTVRRSLTWFLFVSPREGSTAIQLGTTPLFCKDIVANAQPSKPDVVSTWNPVGLEPTTSAQWRKSPRDGFRSTHLEVGLPRRWPARVEFVFWFGECGYNLIVPFGLIRR